LVRGPALPASTRLPPLPLRNSRIIVPSVDNSGKA